jgi:beta-aspartyl-peptidase (threonine type)
MLSGCHIKGVAPRWAVIVHGGFLSPERSRQVAVEQEFRVALTGAVRAAGAMLERNGSGMDAVEAAIAILEDCPQFDAGRGSALTAEGLVEMDAAIMRGQDLMAGAVAGVTRVRNPIRAARAVLERSSHVLLQGTGADQFARQQGLDEAELAYFVTERMREHLRAARQQGALVKNDMGTVGCVVLDADGQITAGTSTGGTTNKLPGRVGDSPLIGAGTYADSRVCGVSATGQGEYFIRIAAAHTVCALMEMKGLDLESAVDQVIQRRLTAVGGKGGLIALDAAGTLVARANIPGLMFAALRSDGAVISAFDEG